MSCTNEFFTFKYWFVPDMTAYNINQSTTLQIGADFCIGTIVMVRYEQTDQKFL